MSISVCADAFLPNFQERVFEVGATRLEITFYTNALCLLAMCVTFSMTGQLQVCCYVQLYRQHQSQEFIYKIDCADVYFCNKYESLDHGSVHDIRLCGYQLSYGG